MFYSLLYINLFGDLLDINFEIGMFYWRLAAFVIQNLFYVSSIGYLENILVSDLEIELLNQFMTKIITNSLYN